jgi:hypothetical protein
VERGLRRHCQRQARRCGGQERTRGKARRPPRVHLSLPWFERAGRGSGTSTNSQSAKQRLRRTEMRVPPIDVAHATTRPRCHPERVSFLYGPFDVRLRRHPSRRTRIVDLVNCADVANLRSHSAPSRSVGARRTHFRKFAPAFHSWVDAAYRRKNEHLRHRTYDLRPGAGDENYRNDYVRLARTLCDEV